MDVDAFDFDLPAELIAQEPAAGRESARLLRLDRRSGAIVHGHVSALPEWLSPGDLLVVNNTKVFPARLLGTRVPSGGAVECLLVRRVEEGCWEALVHPGQKLKPDAEMVFPGPPVLHGRILDRHFHGRRTVRLWTDDGSSTDAAIDAAVDAIGHVPLPPYIKREDRATDRERYQTVFASQRGAIAAPTAGLHFTPALVGALGARGVETAEITLHVGYGTFAPVRATRVEDHQVASERYDIPESAAEAVNRARAAGRRVIAVGTTTTRALESAGRSGTLVAGSGETELFIFPGFQFRVVDGLMTNFHLPKSSLLMLVAAFAGTDHVMAAYRAAVGERYRFYSYGDAMIIL